jgi:hypothetical protein
VGHDLKANVNILNYFFKNECTYLGNFVMQPLTHI